MSCRDDILNRSCEMLESISSLVNPDDGNPIPDLNAASDVVARLNFLIDTEFDIKPEGHGAFQHTNDMYLGADGSLCANLSISCGGQEVSLDGSYHEEDPVDEMDVSGELEVEDLTLRLRQQAALLEKACAEIDHVTTAGVSGISPVRQLPDGGSRCDVDADYAENGNQRHRDVSYLGDFDDVSTTGTPTVTPIRSRPGRGPQVKATLNALKERVGELETELQATRINAVDETPPRASRRSGQEGSKEGRVSGAGSPFDDTDGRVEGERGMFVPESTDMYMSGDVLCHVQPGQLPVKEREEDRMRALNKQLEASLCEMEKKWGEERAIASAAAASRMDEVNRKQVELEVGRGHLVEPCILCLAGVSVQGVWVETVSLP